MRQPGGKVIYLNGTSSAGKTTLSHELQKILPEPFLYIGIDLFIDMLPDGYWDNHPDGFTLVKSDEGVEVKMGKVASDLCTAMLATVRLLAERGHNLIVDDVILSLDYLAECLETLKGIRHLMVLVNCPPEIAAQRELARGDREIGFVKFQYNRIQAVKAIKEPDFEVDTGGNSAAECALQIKDRVEKEWF